VLVKDIQLGEVIKENEILRNKINAYRMVAVID